MGEWQYTSTYSQPKHKLHTLTTSHRNTVEQAMTVTTTYMSTDSYGTICTLQHATGTSHQTCG